MNIVLIGFRGTGKSSIAELVALSTNRQVFRVDEEVEKRAGLPISEIVQRHGWERFWELEAEICAEVGAMTGMVIDAGGGVVQRPENVAALKTHGTFFWLTAEPETIKTRIKHDESRPSITGKKSFLDEVEEVLEARLPLYEAAADHVIETDKRSLAEIGDEIVATARTVL
ncbi:MAG: shikimate kinase [Candidatus Hydrogenedentota bacterium]